MKILEYLQSPAPVAKFQRLCGVRWVNQDPNDTIYPKEEASTSTDGKEKAPQYRITNRLLFLAAKGGSELAGEPFYYVFFPACAWIFEIRTARKTMLMLASVMYVGQSMKDLLKWPRPYSPPVIRLDDTYETEYGMPSTHTMCAVTASFALLIFVSQSYQVSVASGIFLASLWSLSVITSRIYLGMHTILDTLVGTVLSGVLIYLFRPFVEWFEQEQLLKHSPLTSYVGIGSMLLSWIMFRLDSGIDHQTGKPMWNTARGDTAEILGWCAGFLIGSCQLWNNITATSNTPHVLPSIDQYPALRCTIRFLAGAVILGPATLVMRKLLLHFFIRVNGATKIKIEEAKKLRPIEMPYKFLTSLFSGVLSTVFVPAMLQHFQVW